MLEDFCCLNLRTTLCLIGLVVVYKAICWFMQPYTRYKNQSGDRSFSFYINGEKQVTSKITLPLLLRQSKSNPDASDHEHISPSELCDLTLVVPCYNEEQRLPAMLDSHLAYIKEK